MGTVAATIPNVPSRTLSAAARFATTVEFFKDVGACPNNFTVPN